MKQRLRGILRGMMTAALLLACIQHTFALTDVISVTKETQAEQGLDFTLSAVRLSKDTVSVEMEIPKKGKLQNLKRVTMVIGQGTPLVAANLETTPGENGSWLVSFQIVPDLADECSIDLLVATVPASGLDYQHYYAVELKGYVTDKK